ncbi:TPA: hypothetical protein HA344_07405 [Candidatus Bathyarchaeota archaeon]|nr:hypothetical protein [Candidatus Bathyarchaeota archaeon]
MGITVLWVTWHRIFAYSPDKRYRMNRYTEITEEQKTLTYEPRPELGGVIVWNPLENITRKQFILEKWARNTNVEISAYIDESIE